MKGISYVRPEGRQHVVELYCWPYGETHHPTGYKDQGDQTGAGRHARKRATERLSVSVGAAHNRANAYREGGVFCQIEVDASRW